MGDYGADAAVRGPGDGGRSTLSGREDLPPLLRLRQRMEKATARLHDVREALSRTADRMTGDVPQVERAAREPDPVQHGGQYAEMEYGVIELEKLADAYESTANRITALG